MELTDTHTHTYFSHHGEGTVEEVVAAAEARGLTTVALTEHLPMPQRYNPDGTFAMDESEVSLYLDAIERAREAHPAIEVITGTEVDWRWGAEDYILERIEPFELLLGSVLKLSDESGDHWEFDHPGLIDGWEERGETTVWNQYLELWLQAVRSAVPFDIMTHPDLPKKLGFKPQFDTREYYAAMAEAAAQRGVMVEVNTSGLHKPVGEMYPAPALLKAFCDAGVLCTVSSDAHTPQDVGRDIELAHALMREVGYKAVTVPTRNGDRRQIAL
jgi:histidinol-phosphatase (PHP family)